MRRETRDTLQNLVKYAFLISLVVFIGLCIIGGTIGKDSAYYQIIWDAIAAVITYCFCMFATLLIIV